MFLHGALLLAFMVRAVFNAGPAHDPCEALSVLPLSGLLSIATPSWLTDQSGHSALVNLPLIVATLRCSVCSPGAWCTAPARSST